MFFGCPASHALEKPGCQQQAHSALHKSDGRANIFGGVLGVHQYTWKITEVALKMHL